MTGVPFAEDRVLDLVAGAARAIGMIAPLFALALFLGAKLFGHWVPAEWSTPGDRIALVFKTEAELADALGLHSVLGLRQIESIADLLQLAEQFV